MNRRLASSVLCAVLAAAAWAPGALAALSRIGAAAAVAGGVTAQSEGELAGHVLSSGKPVFLRDHVLSDGKGRMQVLLLDETVFTLGPDADMVLDEFVYDPKERSGKVTAQVVKGAFRFVTGRIAAKDPREMKVKLPVGSIGIRGTVVAGLVEAGRSLVVLLGPGEGNTGGDAAGAIDVFSAGETRRVSTPGFGVAIEGRGPPSKPFRVPQAQLDAIGAALAPKPEASPDEGKGGQPGSDAQLEVDSAVKGLRETEPTIAQASANQETATQGTQGGSRTGRTATWDDMRSFGGQTFFSSPVGANTYTRTVGGPGSGTWHWHLFVDFANREVGGVYPSSVHLEPGPLGDIVADFGATSFASFAGNATLTLSDTAGPGVLVPRTGGFAGVPTNRFNGSTITFENHGGSITQATMDLIYDDTTNRAVGTAVGTPSATGLQ